jgi:steroid delta-isomerase
MNEEGRTDGCESPALLLAQDSWRCVEAKDKEAWLDLMAEDVCVEDLIGVAPASPDGDGIRGKEAMRKFWESNVDPNPIAIEPHESFAVGNESAHRMTLMTEFSTGMKMIVNGIFSYRMNDEGKLTNFCGYWSPEDSKVIAPPASTSADDE